MGLVDVTAGSWTGIANTAENAERGACATRYRRPVSDPVANGSEPST
jgi:hypothetical protein